MPGLIRCNWPISASNGWPVHCDAGSAAVYPCGGCNSRVRGWNSAELDALRDAAIALDSMREHFDAETISSP